MEGDEEAVCPLCRSALVLADAVTLGKGERLKYVHPACFEWLKEEKRRRAANRASEEGSGSGPLLRAGPPKKPPRRRPSSMMTAEGENNVVDGVWQGASAGGGYNELTFGRNPQFHLHLESPGLVTFTLQHTREDGNTDVPFAVGLQICLRDGLQVTRVNSNDILQVALHQKFEMTHDVELDAGVIYTIVPHTLEAAQEASFQLTAEPASGSGMPASAIALTPWVDPLTFEYGFVESDTGAWEGSLAGGSISCASCHRNPQWFVFVDPAIAEATAEHIGADGKVDIAIALEQEDAPARRPSGKLLHIGGFLVDKGGSRFNERVLLKQDIVGDTGEYTREKTVLWRGRVTPRDEAYVLLPTAFEPRDEAAFVVRVYADVPLRLVRAPDYDGREATYGNRVSIDAEWRGFTAGGCLNHETCVNNPVFYLSLPPDCKEAEVELTLTQRPSGGSGGGALAIPNQDLRHIGIAVGRSLQDLQMGRVLCSSGPHVNARTVSAALNLSGAQEHPLCVIASVFEPLVEGAFTLTFESDAMLQVVSSIPDLDANYTSVKTWCSGWRAGDVGYFDNPQLAVTLEGEPGDTTEMHVSLIQTPSIGCGYLEMALLVVRNEGMRVMHNGFDLLTDTGDYAAEREASVTFTVDAADSPITLFPTNLEPGIECQFTLIIRSSRPVETASLRDLDEDEQRAFLIQELETERKVHALTSINTRVDLRDSVDARIAERTNLERLGLGETIRRVSSTTQLPDEFTTLVNTYEEEAEADAHDPTAQANIERRSTMSPIWTVPVQIPHALDAGADADADAGAEGVYEERLDSRMAIGDLVDALVGRPEYAVPDGHDASHYTVWVSDSLAGQVALARDDALQHHLQVHTRGEQVRVAPFEIRLHLDLGAGMGRDVFVAATHTCAQALEVAAQRLGMASIARDFGLLQFLPADWDMDSVEDTQQHPTERARWLHADQCLGVHLDMGLATQALHLRRQPHLVRVEAHFFEVIQVPLRIDFSLTVGQLKQRVLEAPELSNHVVPALFRTHGLFDGRKRMLSESRTLRDEGVDPGETLVLRIKPQDGGDTTGTDAGAGAGAAVAGAAAAGAGVGAGVGAGAAGAAEGALEGASEGALEAVSLWDDLERHEGNWKLEVLDNGGQVLSAANLNQLVIKLTGLDGDLAFQETFLLTYEAFATAAEVMDKLVERYNVPPQEMLPKYAGMSADQFSKKVVIPIRHQVLSIVIAWAQYFSKYLSAEDRIKLEATAHAVDPKGSMTNFVANCLGTSADESVDAEAKPLLLRVLFGEESKSKVVSFPPGMSLEEGKMMVGKKFEVSADALGEYQYSTAASGVLDASCTPRACGLGNLEEVVFRRSNLEVGEQDGSTAAHNQVLLRVVLADGTSKTIAFDKYGTVGESMGVIGDKFGIPHAELEEEAYELSCEEYGVMDVDQPLQTYALRRNSPVHFAPAGRAPTATNKSIVLRVVCDDKTTQELVFQQSHNVGDAINYIGVKFGALDVSRYDLKCVQMGRLHRNNQLGSYALPPKSEVYFTRRNTSDGTNDCINYTLIRPKIVMDEARVPKPKVPKRKAASITIWDLNEAETARQLTLMDHEAYAMIEPIELLDQAWTREKYAYRCANLLAFIHRFNRISSWVCQTVLAETKVRKRAQVLKWHIKLATELRKNCNFHGLMAVLGGIGNPAVSRLKWTKARLGKRVSSQLAELEETMSMQQGYRTYRSLLDSSTRAVPYIGVFLTDLIFIEDGNPDFVEGNLIHWSKWRMARNAISELRKFQNKPYSFVPVANIQTYLNAVIIEDDKALYDRSLVLEPRGADRSDIL